MTKITPPVKMIFSLRVLWVLLAAIVLVGATLIDVLAATPLNFNAFGGNITNVSQLTLLDPPSDCATVNYFLTRWSGLNSTCTQLNIMAAVFAGSGVSIVQNANGSINISASGGSGSGNLTSTIAAAAPTGTIVTLTNSTNVRNVTGANFTTTGDLYLPGNVIQTGVNRAGGDLAYQFRNTSGVGFYYVAASDRGRMNFGSGKTGEIVASSIYWDSPSWSMYNDASDTTFTIDNSGSKGGNLILQDGNFTMNRATGVVLIANLTGSGTDYVCVNATGHLFRSNAAC